MNAPIKSGTMLIISIWFFINMVMGLVQGKRPNCMGDKKPDDKSFSEPHYDEIGIVRDTCVELARNLHKKLKMSQATEPCTILANTRTSTRWLLCKWNKWTRTGNKKVNDDVMKKALTMIQNFNRRVCISYKISDINDQEFIIKCIDLAIERLTKSGVADENPDIIKEIDQLKITYCQDYLNYLNHLEEEKEKAEAQRQKEALDTALQEEARRKQQELENQAYNWALNHKYPLHETVFEENIDRLGHLLRLKFDVNVKDKHGNTPLHLAVMLGRTTCIDLLLDHGVSVRSKNLAGWSPMEEAVSFGNRDAIISLWYVFHHQLHEDLVARRKLLIPRLNKIEDFYVELKWSITSSVPLVSTLFLPSDLYRIRKRGQSVRLDTLLAGDITMLLDGSDSENPCLYEINHNDRDYGIEGIHPKNDDEIIDEADKKMSYDIASFHVPTESMTFTRAQSGWFSPVDKSEMVGSFMADFYTINGLKLVSRKRREHLTKKEIQRNEAASIVNILARGYTFSFPQKTYTTNHKSLSPPRCQVTWEQYINSEPGAHPTLGRQIVLKEDIIPYKGEVGMSKEFPVTTELLMNILEIIAPFKQFSQLREFVKANMPPGFPVKLEIPIMLTASARFEFLKFEFQKHDENLFKIPEGYKSVCYRNPEMFAF